MLEITNNEQLPKPKKRRRLSTPTTFRALFDLVQIEKLNLYNFQSALSFFKPRSQK